MARGGNASGRDRAAATMVAAAVLLLAGCNAEPAPVVTETPSASPSPAVTATPSATPSPTPSATASPDPLLDALPEGATAPGLGGAIITAKFFLEQYGPMFHTGDTTVWESLSAPQCGYCTESATNARVVRERGWTAEGGDLTPAFSPSRAELNDRGWAYLVFPVQLDDAYLVKDGGSPELVEGASTREFSLELRPSDSGWRVSGVFVGGE